MSDDDFESLLSHIKEQRGFDFTGYKRANNIPESGLWFYFIKNNKGN